MLGDTLMGVLYRNYSVPIAKGRYVDMGMSFKKNEEKAFAQTKSRRPKRKPGELRALVLSVVTTKWQKTQDICKNVDAAQESVRSCLDKLVRQGLVQSFGQQREKEYRRAP